MKTVILILMFVAACAVEAPPTSSTTQPEVECSWDTGCTGGGGGGVSCPDACNNVFDCGGCGLDFVCFEHRCSYAAPPPLASSTEEVQP